MQTLLEDTLLFFSLENSETLELWYLVHLWSTMTTQPETRETGADDHKRSALT